MKIYCFKTLAENCQALADTIRAVSIDAIDKRGHCSLVLSGGSTPRPLYSLLAAPPYRTTIDWNNIRIFFGDERLVEKEAAESNYRMAQETLLGKLDIPQGNIHRMRGEADPAAEVARYQRVIETECGGASDNLLFDLNLLGLGSDGHTASIFPEAQLPEEAQKLVAVVAPPAAMQPAVGRITLTMSAINRSRHICMIVNGAGKEEVVAQIIRGVDTDSPASRVARQDLAWYLSEMVCPASRTDQEERE